MRSRVVARMAPHLSSTTEPEQDAGTNADHRLAVHALRSHGYGCHALGRLRLIYDADPAVHLGARGPCLNKNSTSFARGGESASSPPPPLAIETGWNVGPENHGSAFPADWTLVTCNERQIPGHKFKFSARGAGFGPLCVKVEDRAVKFSAQRAGSHCASAWPGTFGLASLRPGVTIEGSASILQCA